jgi:hypothetical protein
MICKNTRPSAKEAQSCSAQVTEKTHFFASPAVAYRAKTPGYQP